MTDTRSTSVVADPLASSGRAGAPRHAASRAPRRRPPAGALHSAVFRLGVVATATAVAFYFTLGTLASQWRYGSPVADSALAPFLALGLGFVAYRRNRWLGTTRIGCLDLAVGLLAAAGAAVVVFLLPVTSGNYYWPARLDVFAMPLFAASAVVLLLGARSLIALWFPIAFLTFAWPVPYRLVLDQVESGLTAATGSAAGAVIRSSGLGHTTLSADGLLQIHMTHAGRPFVLSVASVCSGVESLVGFALVVAAGWWLITGPLLRKVLWVAVGGLALWAGNVIRIVAIAAVGHLAGSDVALGVVHPLAGLVVLAAVAFALTVALPRFGLGVRSLRPVAADNPLTRPAPPEQRASTGALAARLALVVALVGAFLTAVPGLREASAAFANAGLPVRGSFQSNPHAGPGYAVTVSGRYDWSRAYFGRDSVWMRYRLTPTTAGAAWMTVWVDSIVTSDLNSLSAHPVADCYHYHRFAVHYDRRRTLHRGVLAEQIVFTSRGRTWHALNWEWPVLSRTGRVRYERIVLLASSTLASPPGGDAGAAAGTVRDRVVSAFNAFAPDKDTNTALSEALWATANRIIDIHPA